MYNLHIFAVKHWIHDMLRVIKHETTTQWFISTYVAPQATYAAPRRCASQTWPADQPKPQPKPAHRLWPEAIQP